MADSPFTPEQEKRISLAKEAIDAVCNNYKVILVPSMTFTPYGITDHGVGIMPQKEESRIMVPKVNEKKIIQDGKGGQG
jgi:hypothetical protein